MLLLWPLISISCRVPLIYLLITNHFEVSFVYEVTSREIRRPTSILWPGGADKRLARFLVLAHGGFRLARYPPQNGNRDSGEFLPWVIVVTSITDRHLPQPGCLLPKIPSDFSGRGRMGNSSPMRLAMPSKACSRPWPVQASPFHKTAMD